MDIATWHAIIGAREASRRVLNQKESSERLSHPYIGTWITNDGQIRQQLLLDGRYDQTRGTRQSAYQGRYEIRGSHIEYLDDSGLTADGEVIDGVLHHGDMVLYRQQ